MLFPLPGRPVIKKIISTPIIRRTVLNKWSGHNIIIAVSRKKLPSEEGCLLLKLVWSGGGFLKIGRKRSRKRKQTRTQIQLNAADRINTVFDLRMRGLAIKQIAERLDIPRGTVGGDLHSLKSSITKPETLRKLSGTQSKSVLERRKLVFDWSVNEGLRAVEIKRQLKAIGINVSSEQIRLDLLALRKDAPENLKDRLIKLPAQRKESWELRALARRRNKVFDLLMKGFTTKQIASELKTKYDAAYKDARFIKGTVSKETRLKMEQAAKRKKEAEGPLRRKRRRKKRKTRRRKKKQ